MKTLILALALCLPIQAQQQKFMGTANGWYPWSAPDKAAHFKLGVFEGMVTYAFFNDYLKVKHPMLWTALAMALVGMSKEWYDRHHHGTPEYADALCTFEGGLVGAGFIYKIRF